MGAAQAFCSRALTSFSNALLTNVHAERMFDIGTCLDLWKGIASAGIPQMSAGTQSLL